ncbi:thioredoxin-disulfide reductase [Breoghania sp.]|uniref:thioredoxin-disulfide reductase n=1 Tax=Breoghania sp. TaxID=2065378 RepID=UPI0026362075|nr:thioredoxin-disulfide reductase [Breoghania sp.]MDJ0932575.1 thioredoxin-disulfide reductase [Breoghania sp.]
MTTKHTKLLIIGSGPAGYTAAIYAARAMMEPTLIAGLQPGGQLTITTEVENYPGFADLIQGPWLMEQMQKQAENVGTDIAWDLITEADLTSNPKRLVTDSGTTYTADAVVIATGAQAKWLGIPSEQTYMGAGVSACATCDGFFYRGRKVIVVGGGNSAVEEALYLANLADEVTVVHRREEFRAEKIMQERLFAHPKVTVLWNHTLDEILGDGTPPAVTGARLKNVKTGETTDLAADGVFIAIGHAPAVDLFKDQVKLKPAGYIWTEADSTKTSLPGVFAAGDVTDEVYRQAVTAAGMGCMAALEAKRYLAELGSSAEEAAE